VIDREFNAVCRAIWGYGLDDFTDDDVSPNDHAWLDSLTQESAFDFHGYDLKDYIHGGWALGRAAQVKNAPLRLPRSPSGQHRQPPYFCGRLQ
jgi:hypothetical protein